MLRRLSNLDELSTKARDAKPTTASPFIEQALRVLTPGGRLFIGDNKNLSLLPVFLTEVQPGCTWPANYCLGRWR